MLAHRTRRGVIEEGQAIDLTRVCESATPGFRPPEYGHVLSETGAEDAPSNQSDLGKGRRRHPPTKLNGHTARRNCGKQNEVVWDSELLGFGLRFRPPGSKTWIVQFRERGVSRTLSLGSVGTVDAETARDKARKRLAENKLDGLPTRKKDAPPKSILFRDYVDEFLEDYARHWKPSTTYRNKHAITHQLLPVFGNVPLASITRADVMRWRDGMASRSGTFNLDL
jgi:hypothetical protein